MGSDKKTAHLGPGVSTVHWFKACHIEDVPPEGGACVQYKNEQIALFNFSSKEEWFATQNLCPHKLQMSLSRGITGDKEGEPKVACPFHKKTFSLKSGLCLDDHQYAIKTYPVRVEEGEVYIGVS